MHTTNFSTKIVNEIKLVSAYLQINFVKQIIFTVQMLTVVVLVYTLHYSYYIFVAIQPPLVPVVADVITTPYSANVSWMVTSIVHDAETYTVYYGTDSIALVNSTERLGPATISDTYTITINGLMPFTTYYYIVSAVNSEGTTNTSVMTFMTDEAGMAMVIVYNRMILLFVAPVIAPQNFRYTDVTATSITFEWNPLTGQGVNGMVRNYTVNCAPGSIMVSSISSKNNTMIFISNVIGKCT